MHGSLYVTIVISMYVLCAGGQGGEVTPSPESLVVWLIEHNDLALSDSDAAPDVLDSDADSLTDEFNDDPPLLEVERWR